jgi:hypothetical protein
MSEVGYKKPPKNTQFGAKNGNPQGRTSEQRKMEIANAERATRIRARMLEALEGLMNDHPEKEAIVGNLVKGDILRLIKEAEDRGLGTPVQSINMESPDGTMTPRGLDVSKLSTEALAEIMRAADAPKPE